MDNPEYTFQILEVFSKIKTKEIPRELEEYISYVARTGDPVFQWSLVKILIKEKLLAVLNEFKESNPSLDIPPCPNVDPFNYEIIKNNLLSRLDSFILPPFTIQRICELLSAPRKEYNRIDKYMRAVEKNVLVVSACELSLKRGLEAESNESIMNGMLYEKVNDSLGNFTNHVFSTSHEPNVDELHLSGKLDVPESDAVQQILDESWTEAGDSDEFKINEANSSSLSVSFDNELQFVTEKSTSNDKFNITGETESKNLEQSTSFAGNDNLLIEPTLQNMIVDNASISYETDTLKSSTPAKSETVHPTTEGDKSDENIFNFTDDDSQTNINTPNESNLLVRSDNENVLSVEKECFDATASTTPLKSDTPSTSKNDVESNSQSRNDDENFSQVNDKDVALDKKNEAEEQYKAEHIFEYEDFSEISTKNQSLKEYNFGKETSKDQVEDAVLRYSDEIMNVDEKPNENQNTKLAPVNSIDHSNDSLTTLFEDNTETSEQIIDETSPSNKIDKQEHGASFSCGDKESPRNFDPSECSKESDSLPAVHGELESTSASVEQPKISSSEK